MRARQRHFKPKSASASLALDTRYIHGVSDNTTVQTWTDLSGNSRDATQATAADRATYRTAIQGGNGILRFNNDFYAAAFTTGTAFSTYSVYKRTGSPSNPFNNVAFVYAAGKDGGTALSDRRYQFTYDDGTPNKFNNYAQGVSISITRDDNWNLHSASMPIGTGTGRYFLNGANEQTASVSALAGVTSGTVRMVIGDNSWITASSQLRFIGDLGSVLTFETAHEAPLRKRIEHAQGYSFKIACS
jgi:hypothetical protein